jgi:predicted glycogen debranching enzyme
VLPFSGKLRELVCELPHIVGTLGCRILHLLPVNPTPTTYARFGRFGSPYAALDLTAIDPALVVFDKRSTGEDQFRELTYETHRRSGRVFLDIVINHTGWGSVLQENRPEWFLRQPDETFVSPGAWGVTWEDLVELKHENVALWDELSEIFLTWCRRGVDGFRCDAGYKVPVPAWQYIVARVQQEYPETIFLLEGLGGAWEATEGLLTDGGMQWAYSELFQNSSAQQVSGYLAHSLKQSQRVGLLVHYSETHDNERLAERGRAWSLLRNRLCALTSVSGGFGFTCGVEWLAPEKIKVHGSTGLAWENPENIVPELSKLNALLANHPCFFDGAALTSLSANDSRVYALQRVSQEGKDTVLVLVNTDIEQKQTLELESPNLKLRTSRDPAPPRKPSGSGPASKGAEAQAASLNPGSGLLTWVDLLGQELPEFRALGRDRFEVALSPGAAFCLAPAASPLGLHGDDYRRARARAAWAVACMNHAVPLETVDGFDWLALAAEVDRSPADFLSSISQMAMSGSGRREEVEKIPGSQEGQGTKPSPFPCVITWTLLDLRRVTLIPPYHWLLIHDSSPFRANLTLNDGTSPQNVESVAVKDGYIACFSPRKNSAQATLQLERYSAKDQRVQASLRFLSAEPDLAFHVSRLAFRGPHATTSSPENHLPVVQMSDLVLLTNGRGGMARICVDLGRITSKYDCILGANLHPTLPVDRHVLAKRLRLWVNADGFISPLDLGNLNSFEPGPPAVWHFVAQAGDGRTVEVQMAADMLEGRNTTVFQFSRPTAAQATGKQLPPEADVRLSIRLDIEDRNFHWETKHNGGAEHHFSSHVRPLENYIPKAGPASKSSATNVGFIFSPAHDRQLRVFADAGIYHPQSEWADNIAHPVEQSRGQTGSGDAYSPGWFELPLPKGANAHLVITADPADPSQEDIQQFETSGAGHQTVSNPSNENLFGKQLLKAIRAFVVQRGTGKTVIAGYPWFLDWGRDTFICARGLLAAGLTEEVKQTLVTFARFEKDGTLPNTIFGEDASNRDTSDAPLWFGVVCEELAGLSRGGSLYSTAVDRSGRSMLEVLGSIANNYLRGTPNGIRVDPATGLVWSPSHFTWMDTNYPACTPREGYPVEIQALWVRLLRQLARVDLASLRPQWEAHAAKAVDSLEKLFWREDSGYYADVLLAKSGQGAAQARVDDALRNNCLFLVSLGLSAGERARRCVSAASRYLVVPGALRTLAPLPVSVPLPNYANQGGLLNNPAEPYWGRYEGDEDTRRKPAYHNGTAWTWIFPVFCEALARAWDFEPQALAAARAYLGSMDGLMTEGCLGQLPEIIDGDAPHTQRGCDAQAWGATEALRVWKFIKEKSAR